MMAESPPSRPPPDLETLQFNAWDAEFSAEMSNKMRVPDSIRVAGDSKGGSRDFLLTHPLSPPPPPPALSTEASDAFAGFNGVVPATSSAAASMTAASPLRSDDPFGGGGMWGRPVGPDHHHHHQPSGGLMHPHDALEMNRDRTRRSMTVPQRILVAGDEADPEAFLTSVSRQHSSSSSSAPSRHQMELDLSSAAAPSIRGPGGDSGIQLSTPPEVLTIEANIPTVYHEETPLTERPPRPPGLPGGDPRSASPLLIRRKPGPGAALADATAGYASLQGSVNDVSVAHLNMTSLDESGAISTVQEETLLLRRHVAKLSRRVNALEQDNLRRSYREYLFYPVMLGYFIVKLIGWVRRPY